MAAAATTRQPGGPVLRVDDLSIDFWVDGTWYPAVEGASFTLAAGEVLAIVGESGSGKSTVAMRLAAEQLARARLDQTG